MNIGGIGVTGGLQEITRNDVVAVGINSVIVSTPRTTLPKRLVVTIRNTSSNAADIISLSFGVQPAENGKGIVLKPSESITDSADGQYFPYQDQISAICATANGQVSIFER